MHTPGRGRLRLTRGLVLALSCLGIPVLAHVAAGGDSPDSGPFLLIALVFAALCVAMADRRRGVAEIGAVVLVSQPALHVLFVLSTHSGNTGSGLTLTMVGAHALAGLLLTALLAGAEASLWALHALLSRVAPAVPGRAAAPYASPPPMPVRVPAVRRLPSRLLLHSLGRRGPPVTAAA